ncbi:hypothetical protein THAOC_18211 [Thalassiosira oceanica]|uniref:RING-type domain-containing protein n=1 Tax=Thalassiosira oceanica TaxID=159749 RepID=K0S7T6_THAOC|nr:hypothetical protein THAOC_18211 [Thalassiosira oceanica]|eukprot:EJK61325.1 hypothetical protein THAOC_18211 [Thalassiosira oceanica]
MGDVTEKTCGICLEGSKDPLDLPCGHSFCDGCLSGWRSRYGGDKEYEDEMRTKCPICRARIPPSRELVSTLLSCRANKKRLEDNNETSSEDYDRVCLALEMTEKRIGADWDGVTVLEKKQSRLAATLPNYLVTAMGKGDIRSVLKWIDANRAEDRVNAVSSAEMAGMPLMTFAAGCNHLSLMTLLLQRGADVNLRNTQGITTLGYVLGSDMIAGGNRDKMIRLLLSWGTRFFTEDGHTRECYIAVARRTGAHELANLLKSELGGRRCEIVNLSSRPELNGKTCVADEYLFGSNQYKVTLENKSKEVLVLSSDNLKRRDRTPQDCGYYIEFKNGRTIRHDFDSSEDCKAFVAALNGGETQPVVTEEAEARAEQAAADLLAELGLDDSPSNNPHGDGQIKKSKKKKTKKKGGKKKK